MPEYLHPGVYIEEIERGPRPIEGVPTSTAAFLGETERGPITPTLVTSYKDYQRWFGDVFDDDKFLPYAVNGFFENGGKRAVRLPPGRRWRHDRRRRRSATSSSAPPGPGTWGKRVLVKIADGTHQEAGRQQRSASACSSPTGATSRCPASIRSREQDAAAAARTDRRTSTISSTDESSPDYYGKRFPFIDLDKGETNQGPESSALGMLVRNAGVDRGRRPANGDAAARRRRRRSGRARRRRLQGPRARAAARSSRAWRRSSSIRTATSRWSTRPTVGRPTSPRRSSTTARACASASR